MACSLLQGSRDRSHLQVSQFCLLLQATLCGALPEERTNALRDPCQTVQGCCRAGTGCTRHVTWQCKQGQAAVPQLPHCIGTCPHECFSCSLQRPFARDWDGAIIKATCTIQQKDSASAELRHRHSSPLQVRRGPPASCASLPVTPLRRPS